MVLPQTETISMIPPCKTKSLESSTLSKCYIKFNQYCWVTNPLKNLFSKIRARFEVIITNESFTWAVALICVGKHRKKHHFMYHFNITFSSISLFFCTNYSIIIVSVWQILRGGGDRMDHPPPGQQVGYISPSPRDLRPCTRVRNGNLDRLHSFVHGQPNWVTIMTHHHSRNCGVKITPVESTIILQRCAYWASFQIFA